MNARLTFLALAAPLAALAQIPEILVNPQGLAQRDLSIRGSSYTGAGLSLNGLNLKNPWSAHFSTELPFPAELFSTGEAQTGLANAAGYLVGTAAYATRPLQPQATLSAGIGTEEHYQSSVIGSTATAGGFADWEKARRIDYAANDLDRADGGAFAQMVKNGWTLDLLGAYQTKEYGAQGYYGLPAATYAEQRTEDALVYLGATKGDLTGAYLRTGASYRNFTDEYRLPSALLDTEARAQFGGVMIEGRTLEIQHIALTLRGDLEHERVGGDVSAPGRTRGSMLFLPEARFERLSAKAGVNAVFQTDEAAEWLPQAGVDLLVGDNTTLYTAYTETVAQPDFHTLQNNPALRMQTAQTAELGLRHFFSASLDGRIAAFHRRQENASDWIGGSATRLGTLHIPGMEAALSYAPSDALRIKAFYQWLHKDAPVSGGLYETDYPEHLVSLCADWAFAPGFTLFALQALRWQTENPARTSGEFGPEASLGLQYQPRCAKNARLSLRVENLWDTDFQAIPGLQPRPASVFAGFAVSW